MENINLDKIKRIHFIGAGGVSMSALIKLIKSKGIIVSGSDCKSSNDLKSLKKQKVRIYSKHRSKNVVGADLVVFSSAIKNDNKELLKAKQLNLPILSRAEFLSLIAKEYKTVVAISGSHGKTTTTAMISNCFLRYGFNPTIHIGGNYPLISGNLNIGGKDFFITEACEFQDSFLFLRTAVSVVTNIEKEHLDYFKNFTNIKKSFSEFVDNTKEICFINYRYAKYITDKSKIVTFGFNKNAEFRAVNIKENRNGCYSFDCFKKEEFLGRVELQIEGRHSILNALATIATSLYFGVPFRDIVKSLNQFKNVERRFEKLGEYNDNIVIHDYAHHPTEIRTAIKTCLAFKKGIVCIFQPHTYSRTKSLIKSFSTAFLGVESLVLVDTYSAREKYDEKGSCEKLKNEIKKASSNLKVYGVFDKKDVVKFLVKSDFKGKILLFLGAGDIEMVAKRFKTKFIP